MARKSRVEPCHYCLVADGATRDHIIPRAMGGPNAPWNSVPACQACNSLKGNRTYEQFTGNHQLPLSCAYEGYMTTAEWLTNSPDAIQPQNGWASRAEWIKNMNPRHTGSVSSEADNSGDRE